MAIELKVPEVGESITEVEIGAWLKKSGDSVRKDEPVVTLESDKATVELAAPEAGTLTRLLKQPGETAKVGEVIGYLENGRRAEAPRRTAEKQAPTPAPAPAATPAPEPKIMPAAAAAMAESGLRPEQVQATGPGGRVLKEDVLRRVGPTAETKPPSAPTRPQPLETGVPPRTDHPGIRSEGVVASREEQAVPMSRLRRTLAARLVEAQHTAALLTTFNEIDMAEVIALRKQYGERFLQKHQVKLGFMSFFVKASIEALKQFPAVNAEIREATVVYHNYCDIGVAVGGGKGLVVPVMRNAERMSFAEIEIAIGDFARRAKENKLTVNELEGGTFTITNGGVYGSLLSTPIINPPQSGILGLHAIQERPVAREGNVVIRPMMYVALTYDHRLVDGREAVSFLKRIKEVIEAPARLLMEI
jgi:2-oxoglutarate dehydrogenase E2 component (dihydrolipoamide succinyltransferase)